MSAPFMQLYVADYLGDTRHLTTEQHGAYLLILMTMWRSGGRLQNDAKKLARIAGLTGYRWRTISADVLALLAVDGSWLRSPALDEWERQAARLAGRQMTAATRAFVLERDGYRCTYCGTTEGAMEVDHVLAVSRGGSDSLENLVCACFPCNRSKGSRLLADWLSERVSA